MFEATQLVLGSSDNCQDRAAIFRTSAGLALVVADGAGGMSGGRQAAEKVVEIARAAVEDTPYLLSEVTCCDLLSRIDQALAADPQAGETTAVIVVVSAAGVMGASVGDSNAWSIRADSYEVLTKNQRRKPYLGTADATPVPFLTRLANECILAASDGLFNYARWDEIHRTASQPHVGLDDIAGELVDLVRLPSGALQDDVAVVLCRLV